MDFLLYGANGYTGELIARAARERGLRPLLAGRSRQKVEAVARSLDLDFRIFDLSDAGAVRNAVRDLPLVLHAAGPFIRTARPMMEACLQTRTHYLDITGEIDVFEMAHQLDEPARRAGIVVLPGTGFDVVPTDCLALFLKKRLPDATHLKLAFSALGGGVSHGTALTMVENLGAPGAVRRDGAIIEVPVGHKTMEVAFPGKKRFVMTIPWGDVSTAYYTTGIPNIETYTGISPSAYKFVKWQRYLGWLLRSGFVKKLVKRQIEQRPAGPSEEQRRQSRSLVWGEVRNAAGQRRWARLAGPEGYTLTVLASLLIIRKVLDGQAAPGFQTPAGAFGEDLVMEIDGVEREEC